MSFKFCTFQNNETVWGIWNSVIGNKVHEEFTKHTIKLPYSCNMLF